MSNEKVNVEALIESQLSNWSANQLSEHSIILAIQDTTELDLTGKRSSEQLGCLESEYKHGLFLHNTLLCSVEGVPQVLFNQHYWSRDPATLG